MSRTSVRHPLIPLLFGLLGAAVACGGSESPPGTAPDPNGEPAEGVFESDDPNASSSRMSGPGGPTVGGVATGGTSSSAPPTPGAPGAVSEDGGAARAIEEADIIKLEGGLLYALSQYGGLSVIDVSERDSLKLLGRHKIQATPFEMYLRDGIVFALYNGYGDYSYDEAQQRYAYYQTSYVVAIDARDPTEMSVLGKFAVPGSISDSRIVGDVLYAVAFEDGYCWNCGENPRTNLISLDIADAAEIRKVDELHFEDRQDTYSWRRSVMATDQRLYVAGPTWGSNGDPVGSTIQVVDISDAGGDMVEGDSLELSGQINSRWQMDEYDGVLRVISQPFTWQSQTSPRVETFRVESSDEVTPLAALQMKLPRPEQLQSVRFDGTRGYAVTFERTDPLFTIDLSDPANPKQIGELEMPGFLYHMEPRGERLLGLGFDQGNPEGSITVSLFDVSDLAKPSMIDRVNFGGSWGSLAEDQDRIHKAFNVLDEQGLVLIPFAGYQQGTADESGCFSSQYLSGVQLVNFEGDSLDLMGIAPALGQARRGFVHDERLFAMSDERLETFDISDRSAPARTASLPIAQFVHHSAGANQKLVRIGRHWWTNETELDVTPLAKAESPSADGRLLLPQMSQHGCYGGSWLGSVHSHEDQVYLMYRAYDYRPNQGGSIKESTQIVTVDVAEPTEPKVVADVSIGYQPSNYSPYYGLVDNGSSSVNVGSTLALVNRSATYNQAGNRLIAGPSSLDLIDLSDPSAPKRTNLPLPSSVGGTSLLVSESVVATSHYSESPTNSARVRFYLDRVDLSDAKNPVLLPRVNIPGSLLAYDAASRHAITIDYRERTISGGTAEGCYRAYGNAWFEVPGAQTYDFEKTIGLCHTIQYNLLLVDVTGSLARVVDSHELPLGHTVGSTSLGDDRLFVSAGRGGRYYGIADLAGPGYYGASWFSQETTSLLVLGGIRSGKFELGEVALERGDQWGSYLPLAASGTRAVLSSGFRGKLAVIDATNVAAPRVVRDVDIVGYPQDLDLIDDVAVVSLGQDGVKTIQIGD